MTDVTNCQHTQYLVGRMGHDGNCWDCGAHGRLHFVADEPKHLPLAEEPPSTTTGFACVYPDCAKLGCCMARSPEPLASGSPPGMLLLKAAYQIEAMHAAYCHSQQQFLDATEEIARLRAALSRAS